jgi:hypothetical protein
MFISLGIGFRNGVAGLIVANGFGHFMGSSLSVHFSSFWSTWFDGWTVQMKNRLDSHGVEMPLKQTRVGNGCRSSKDYFKRSSEENVYLSTRKQSLVLSYLPGFRRSLRAFDGGWTRKRMHSWCMACISPCQLHSTSGFCGAELLR